MKDMIKQPHLCKPHSIELKFKIESQSDVVFIESLIGELVRDNTRTRVNTEFTCASNNLGVTNVANVKLDY